MTEQSASASPLSRKAFLGLGAAGAGLWAASGTTPAQAAPPPPPRPPSSVDVTAHGARGDGRTDDQPVLQRLVDAAAGGVALYLPPGTYVLGRPLKITDRSFSLVGAGLGVSTLRFTGGGNGLDLSLRGSTAADHATIAELSIETTVVAGDAISAVWQRPPTGGFAHLTIRDVEIAGGATVYFRRGVYASDAWRYLIERYSYGGTGSAGIGIETAGRCVDSLIVMAHLSNVGVGVLFAELGEGQVVYNSRVVGGLVGFRHKGAPASSGRLPWVTIRDCHANVAQLGIDIPNWDQVFISGNLIYQLGAERPEGFTGIRVSNCGSVRISDNTIMAFASAGSAADSGVLVENGSGVVTVANNGLNFSSAGLRVRDSQLVTAVGNQSVNAPVLISFADTARNCIASLNSAQRVRPADGKPPVAVDDQGTGNLVRDNLATVTG